MRLLLVAATPFEIVPLLSWFETDWSVHPEQGFEKHGVIVQPLITGVGMVATTWQLGVCFAENRPDLAINAGIAGALDLNLQIGNVLNVTSERFGDLGVEEADGGFTDLFELGLQEPDHLPFSNALLQNPQVAHGGFLPQASGLTVQKVHGSATSIAAVRRKYPDAQVESMEGAAFFYACLQAKVAFWQIRSISNLVEPRNREGWNLPLAIHNLNETLRQMLEAFMG